jgi:UDP-N-acetylmuramate dehydrogenase
MDFLDDFSEIVQRQVPLAPYTSLKLGGPALVLAQPRSVEELAKLVARCRKEKSPVRVLGGGSNLLVRDEGVAGVVVRLSEPPFSTIAVQGRIVRTGAGALLSSLISETSRHGLTGLESLIGIPGVVGGAIRTNAGSRAGYVAQYIREIEAVDTEGAVQTRSSDELCLGARGDFPEDDIIVAARFELDAEATDSILKRMKKFWIHRKAHQPLSFQAAARMFRDPQGLTADQLIEQSGLQGTRVGGAEISDRHANYVVVHEGATVRDVLRLIDLIRGRVADHFGQHLELALAVW